MTYFLIMPLSKPELKWQIIQDYMDYCNFAGGFPIEADNLLKKIKKELEQYLHYYVPKWLKRWKTWEELLSTLSIEIIWEDIRKLIDKTYHSIDDILREDLPKYEDKEKRKASAGKIREFFWLCPQFISDFLVSSDYYNRNHHLLDDSFFSVHKEHLPSTYRWLIVLLGWDPNKCSSSGYVISLLKWEEQWKKYLKRQKEKIIKPQDIISFFQAHKEFCQYLGSHSYTDNYKVINKAFRQYYQETHNIVKVTKNLPKTIDWLSSLLWWPRRGPTRADMMKILWLEN